jgi:hypothetical protein
VLSFFIIAPRAYRRRPPPPPRIPPPRDMLLMLDAPRELDAFVWLPL